MNSTTRGCSSEPATSTPVIHAPIARSRHVRDHEVEEGLLSRGEGEDQGVGDIRARDAAGSGVLLRLDLDAPLRVDLVADPGELGRELIVGTDLDLAAL